jgi:hypothetical protein
MRAGLRVSYQAEPASHWLETAHPCRQQPAYRNRRHGVLPINELTWKKAIMTSATGVLLVKSPIIK